MKWIPLQILHWTNLKHDIEFVLKVQFLKVVMVVILENKAFL